MTTPGGAVNSAASSGASLQDVLNPPAQRTTSANLTQQDFMQIMIAQLKSQNPLDSSSGDSNQFFSQMVQFQSLDAMTAMQNDLQPAKVSNLRTHRSSARR